MPILFDVVIPVFGLIAIGYGAGWTGLLRPKVGEALTDFVFTLAIPVLIFRTIAEADFAGGAPWRIWLPFFLAFAGIWIVGEMLARRLFHRDARGGLVAGVSAAYGNVVLVGIPLVLAAFGEAGAVPIALIVAVHLPVTMAVSAALIQRAERLDKAGSAAVGPVAIARGVLARLAVNPIIIGIAAGVAWRVFGLPLGGVAGSLVDRIADIAATLALFAMGMSLSRYGVRGNVAAGVMVSALKLVALPLLVLLLARYVVPMPPNWAKVAVLAAACPTGVNAYLIAARFGTGEALSSNAITISTGFAVVTVAAWLWVIEAVF